MGPVRILTASSASEDPGIRAGWNSLLDEYAGDTQYYQSPAYVEHLARWNPSNVFVAVVEGDAGRPVGLVPMRKTHLSPRFQLRDFRRAALSVPTVHILGGTLLAPQTPKMFELLFRSLASAFPDCRGIGIGSVSTASKLWEFLSGGESLSSDFMLYVPDGVQACHTMKVPQSMDDYFEAMSRKRRYNLRRQVRRLDQFAQRSLKLQRIDQVSQVRLLHDARVALAGHATGTRDMVDMPESELLDIAERGLLLSYVLSAYGKPCAVAFGTVFRETLCLHSFLHDTGMNALSPGTVLQTLLMRDLIDSRLVRRIDYRFGASRYRMLNDVDARVTAYLMRREFSNHLMVGGHRLCSGLTSLAKRRLREFGSRARKEEADDASSGTQSHGFRRLRY
jgi:CelD/BcsL family acetyltransferase involved in cellulose biosynthesis